MLLSALLLLLTKQRERSWFVYSGLKKKKQVMDLHMNMHKKYLHNWSFNSSLIPLYAIDFNSTQMMDFLR